MMRKAGIGIIGMGRMGNIFSKILSEFNPPRLVAIADIDENKVSKISHQLKVDGYINYEEMLSREDVNGVVICLPDQLHLKATVSAAKAGKYIFLEKPMATNINDAKIISETVKKENIKLMMGHVLRFDPRYTLAHDIIEKGKIGEIVYIYARRNNSLSDNKRLKGRTSVLYYLGIHDIDLLLWYTGSEAEKVYSESTRKVLRKLSVDDIIVSLIKLKNNTLCLLENCWILPSSGVGSAITMQIIGTKGRINIGGIKEGGISVQKCDSIQYIDFTSLFTINHKVEGIYKREMEHFLQCIINNTSPIVTEEDGEKAVIIADALTRSLENKSPVYL